MVTNDQELARSLQGAYQGLEDTTSINPHSLLVVNALLSLIDCVSTEGRVSASYARQSLHSSSMTELAGTYPNYLFDDLDEYVSALDEANGLSDTIYETEYSDEDPEGFLPVEVTNVIEALYQSGAHWRFWEKWFESFVNGDPIAWEIQNRVARIDESIWQAGPELVAAEIERIEAAFEVESTAAEIASTASAALAARRGIGDNNPPSSIDDAIGMSDGVTIIWAAAQELKEQAHSAQADKSRVVKALSAVAGVMKACGVEIAKIAHLGVKTAIVSACGAVGAGAGAIWVTTNADKLQQLIEAVSRWLPFLG